MIRKLIAALSINAVLLGSAHAESCMIMGETDEGFITRCGDTYTIQIDGLHWGFHDFYDVLSDVIHGKGSRHRAGTTADSLTGCTVIAAAPGGEMRRCGDVYAMTVHESMWGSQTIGQLQFDLNRDRIERNKARDLSESVRQSMQNEKEILDDMRERISLLRLQKLELEKQANALLDLIELEQKDVKCLFETLNSKN